MQLHFDQVLFVKRFLACGCCNGWSRPVPEGISTAIRVPPSRIDYCWAVCVQKRSLGVIYRYKLLQIRGQFWNNISVYSCMVQLLNWRPILRIVICICLSSGSGSLWRLAWRTSERGLRWGIYGMWFSSKLIHFIQFEFWLLYIYIRSF